MVGTQKLDGDELRLLAEACRHPRHGLACIACLPEAYTPKERRAYRDAVLADFKRIQREHDAETRRAEYMATLTPQQRGAFTRAVKRRAFELASKPE